MSKTGTAELLLVVGIAIAALVFAPASVADIYKYIDKYGQVHLTDNPPNKKYRRIIQTRRNGPWRETATYTPGDPAKYDSLINQMAKRYELSRAFLKAVIHTESAFDPNAISVSGAVGLMQLMPATAKRYGVRNRSDPVSNVTGGARYLNDLLKLFNDDPKLALAGYHAGENAVIRNGYKVPPYPATKLYIKKVFAAYRQYRQSM